jgi:hypothetical protein
VAAGNIHRLLYSIRSARVSRVAAFRAQGVALKYALSSWSGVRGDDRMVVFAIRAEEIVVDAEGSRCLLWSSGELSGMPAERERRHHCEIALLHGKAEALLAHGEAAEMDADVVLAVRVVAAGGQFWATWASRARASASVSMRPWFEEARAPEAYAAYA